MAWLANLRIPVWVRQLITPPKLSLPNLSKCPTRAHKLWLYTLYTISLVSLFWCLKIALRNVLQLCPRGTSGPLSWAFPSVICHPETTSSLQQLISETCQTILIIQVWRHLSERSGRNTPVPERGLDVLSTEQRPRERGSAEDDQESATDNENETPKTDAEAKVRESHTDQDGRSSHTVQQTELSASDHEDQESDTTTEPSESEDETDSDTPPLDPLAPLPQLSFLWDDYEGEWLIGPVVEEDLAKMQRVYKVYWNGELPLSSDDLRGCSYYAREYMLKDLHEKVRLSRKRHMMRFKKSHDVVSTGSLPLVGRKYIIYRELGVGSRGKAQGYPSQRFDPADWATEGLLNVPSKEDLLDAVIEMACDFHVMSMLREDREGLDAAS